MCPHWNIFAYHFGQIIDFSFEKWSIFLIANLSTCYLIFQNFHSLNNVICNCQWNFHWHYSTALRFSSRIRLMRFYFFTILFQWSMINWSAWSEWYIISARPLGLNPEPDSHVRKTNWPHVAAAISWKLSHP